MHRTDTPMIRRIMRSDNNIIGAAGQMLRKGPAVQKTMKSNKDFSDDLIKEYPFLEQNTLMETAFKASFCDFSNKMLPDNEWYKWNREQEELVRKGADRSLIGKIVPQEWAFDEFVFSYNEKVLLQTDVINRLAETKSTLNQEKNASMWAYVSMSEAQNSYLNTSLEFIEEELEKVSKPLCSSVYLSLFIHYEGDKHPYHWDGWLVGKGDDNIYQLPNGVLEFDVIPSLFSKTYWEIEDDLFKKDHPNVTSAPRISGLTKHARDCFNYIFQMMSYLKYGPKHLVEVAPSSTAKKRKGGLADKRPWLNATGPKVLLLDRMPSTQTEHQGGTHASPKPHRRRGHWKTLRHPKYRHHPKYQVENGVFIKPSFVGPKQAEYEGNIYKLVEPWPDEVA